MDKQLLALYFRLKKGKTLEIFALSFLLIFSFILRLPALNPPALWYDDLWVGLVSKIHSFDDFLLVKAVSPPLFSLLQFIAIKIIPDKEISMQFFPVLFGLIQIPLFYFLIKKITSGHRWLSFLGAMILAVSSHELLVYSTRAKHYSFDSFATILLLFLYIKLFNKNIYSRYLALFLIASLLLFLGSFTAIVVAGILVHILFFKIIRDWKENYANRQIVSKIKQILLILCFDVAAVFVYFKFLKVNIDIDIYEYWNNFFINIHQSLWSLVVDAVGKLNFFVMMPFHSLWGFISNRIGEHLFLILLLAVLFSGAFYLHKKKLFELLFFVCVFYLAAVVLAMLKLYPMSGGRVDIYSYPVTIMLGVCGIWQIMIFLRFNKLFQRLSFAYFYIVLLSLSLSATEAVQYPYKVDIKEYTSVIEHSITDKDVVLLSPYGDYAFAYYTDWPISYQKYPTATGFIPIIGKHHVFALPSTGVFNTDTAGIKNRMEYFLKEANNFERIYFFSSHCFDEDKKYKNFAYKEYIEKQILENNFSLAVSSKEENTCFLKIYQRNDVAD